MAFGILILLACIVSVSGCVSYQSPSAEASSGIERYELEALIEDIVYTEPGWPQALTADLYLPAAESPRPVVLMVHGGSWGGRDRSDMDEISRTLVRHGYAVFNLSYRFAPRYRYPAQLQDLQQAMKWLVRYSDVYEFDLERINAWGYSAGAHLAALLASYNFSQDSLLVEDHDLPSIRAVVSGGIPSDLRKYEDGPILQRFIGGSRAEFPVTYADASPAYHISSNDPPVFLYHGKLDLLVTVDQSTDYYEALLEQGVQAELYLHAARGHVTMFLFGGDAEQKAIAFLDRKNLPASDG